MILSIILFDRVLFHWVLEQLPWRFHGISSNRNQSYMFFRFCGQQALLIHSSFQQLQSNLVNFKCKHSCIFLLWHDSICFWNIVNPNCPIHDDNISEIDNSLFCIVWIIMELNKPFSSRGISMSFLPLHWNYQYNSLSDLVNSLYMH